MPPDTEPATPETLMERGPMPGREAPGRLRGRAKTTGERWAVASTARRAYAASQRLPRCQGAQSASRSAGRGTVAGRPAGKRGGSLRPGGARPRKGVPCATVIGPNSPQGFHIGTKREGAPQPRYWGTRKGGPIKNWPRFARLEGEGETMPWAERFAARRGGLVSCPLPRVLCAALQPDRGPLVHVESEARHGPSSAERRRPRPPRARTRVGFCTGYWGVL